MLTMIIGGAGSGKSQYGEELLQNCGCERKIYIATMLPTGEESHQRILRHRAQRAGKGFETIECFTSLAKLRLPAGCGALLECVGNLAANELYFPQGAGNLAAEAITTGVENLCRQAKEVIVVTNDVFSDGIDYDEGTEAYLRVMSQVHAWLARRADQVAEVVCGIPIIHKGGEKQ